MMCIKEGGGSFIKEEADVFMEKEVYFKGERYIIKGRGGTLPRCGPLCCPLFVIICE